MNFSNCSNFFIIILFSDSDNCVWFQVPGMGHSYPRALPDGLWWWASAGRSSLPWWPCWIETGLAEWRGRSWRDFCWALFASDVFFCVLHWMFSLFSMSVAREEVGFIFDIFLQFMICWVFLFLPSKNISARNWARRKAWARWLAPTRRRVVASSPCWSSSWLQRGSFSFSLLVG